MLKNAKQIILADTDDLAHVYRNLTPQEFIEMTAIPITLGGEKGKAKILYPDKEIEANIRKLYRKKKPRI